MEFFAVADIKTTVETLQKITVSDLNRYCADIDNVTRVTDENNADIYCLWGEFLVQRQLINGGVRFSLPECPNALAWTLTIGFEPAPERVVVHCTINRTTHDDDFIESIASFVNSWKDGLEMRLLNKEVTHIGA